ncbi:MAG: neutral/alkaline ceramidase [Ignavibacteriaceae bacterium]|nr:neutral/alkaline ceramidase [Ignavibacteriaceae bacterium]
MPDEYLIGTGIYDVTGPAAELGMMGMASIEQKTEGIHSRLFARAFIVCDQNSDKRVVIVSADIWSCTLAVKMEVVNRLKNIYGNGLYTIDNVLLSGTHTHSGPGGYSHYALYNLSILGFDKQNFECIVNGMVQAIKRAHENLAPGKIFVNTGDVQDCGFNRSETAFKSNVEWQKDNKISNTDKEMLLIKFIKNDGKEVGCLNWFAIHPTNRGNKNKLITGDNKGYASYLFEKEKKTNIHDKETFIAAFANSNCGDVSGNVKYGIPDLIHDFDRMKEFGEKQYRKAYELYSSATKQIKGSVDYRHTHVDFSKIQIEGTNNRTYPAALGASMFAGSTEDSKSEFGIVEGIKATISGNYPAGQKNIILEAINLLSGLLTGFKVPGILEDEMKQGHHPKPIVLAQGLAEPYPLSPQILPLQIIRIGNLVLLGVPFELTTMAGRRLRNSILDILSTEGIENIALATYSNGYAGYVTTKEEYDVQHYEGASTHFGPYTLEALQQELGKLASAIKEGKTVPGGQTPKDLSSEQTTLQTSIVADTQPLPWIPFGGVQTDVDSSYKVGATARVIFWGAHPKNNLRTQGTFLEVQRKDGSEWKTIFTDHDTCTTFQWKRDFIANSKIIITWNIPADTKFGEYRICHYGDAKDISGNVKAYSGVSGTFKVGEAISVNEINFKNSFGKQVELWFYHPNDWLRWSAYERKILQKDESFVWKTPIGWGKVQVRFTGPGKWKTISGGESIIIKVNGDIENSDS